MIALLKSSKQFLRFKKIINCKSVLSIGFISAGIISIEPIQSSIIKNSPKEVIDHVWQIIYRDFLDSISIDLLR